MEKLVQNASPEAAGAPSPDAFEQRNIIFMGTNAVSGTVTALVVATGGCSYFGTLAAHATAAETTPNAFQARVNSVPGCSSALRP